MTARPRTLRRQAGFTLLEVMMALLLGMIGLIGTMAMQQVILRATYASNDAMVAMRLATMGMEQLQVATVDLGPPLVDEFAARAAATGNLGVWSPPEFLDPTGGCPTGTAAATPRCRWRREWQVTNTGVALPYNLSVRVTFDIDGTPKLARVDMERRKRF